MNNNREFEDQNQNRVTTRVPKRQKASLPAVKFKRGRLLVTVGNKRMRGVKEQISGRVAGGSRSRMRSKSTRKPLRDVSNAKTVVKSGCTLTKNCQEDGGRREDDSLDHLLLLNSEVSSILRQIDELVFQALQLRDNHGRKEIKQFADVLSDMKASLKPWIPRFQKALNSQVEGPATKLDQTHESSVACCPINKDKGVFIESPQLIKRESLVSPSPLVSWRAECNTEGGRQLFLLTPMPQKKGCPVFETIPSKENAERASPSGLLGASVGDLLEGVSANRPADKVLDKTFGIVHCSSPYKYSKMNCSAFVMTPSLKMSPPKSCILLEPVSVFSRKKNPVVYKATPFPVGFQNSMKSLDSESPGSLPSDDLFIKYPEVLGIKTDSVGDIRQELEDSLHWICSPPKTCSVMEPPHEKSLANPGCPSLLPKVTAGSNQKEDLSSLNESFHYGDPCIASNNLLRDDRGKLHLSDCTPMVKEPMSSYQKGENTLKKELWTKFEAVSSHAICFNHPTLQKAALNGFLDRLDEASNA